MTTKILVVDDESDLELLIRQKFRHKIKNGDLSFEFALNGQAALDKLELGEFDMVLTDINMPVMDGLSLLVKIKEQDRFYKAVVVSAYGDMQTIRAAMNSGAFDFITKPIDFTDLETTINKTIRELEFIREGIAAKENLEITLREKDIAIIEKQKAEEAKNFERLFLANVSHEIRTPMNAIIGMTGLVLKTPLNELQEKYINAIRVSSKNLLVLINDILDLSKIDAGKIELEKIGFGLNEITENVFDILHFKAEEKSLIFNIENEEGIPDILLGDPVRLSQVLLNLAGNAIKFTEKGSVTIKTTIKKRDEKTLLLNFAVKDTGIGISSDKIDMIFESFTQASSEINRKYGGTGLGLTISKELVEKMRGKIEIESQLGEGTVFNCLIPFDIGYSHEHTPDVAKEIPIESIKDLKILLVEDNYFNQIVAIDTLKDLIPGVHIDLSENGKEAIDKLSSEYYDLILMDIQMPFMNGYETSLYIRNEMSSPLNKTPIMAMTANAIGDEINRCFASGMDDYIPKPFVPEQLLVKIHNLVKNYRKL